MFRGGWRQAGVLAACGLSALEDYDVRLRSDHENAKLFADIITQVTGEEMELFLFFNSYYANSSLKSQG